MSKFAYALFLFMSFYSVQGITKPTTSKILVAADEWCPYNCVPNSSEPGYLVEVLQQVFGPLGFEIEYKVMPWKRALIETEFGRVDAAIGAVEANHGSNIIGRQHLGFDQTILVVRKADETVFRYPDSLETSAIGVIADYTYDNLGNLDKYLARRMAEQDRIYTIHQRHPLDSLFKMLQTGRIDVFPENRYVAQRKASELAVSGSVSFIEISVGDRVYVAFKPTDEGKAYSDMLDEGVEALMANGQLAKILSKYQIKPWFKTPGRN